MRKISLIITLLFIASLFTACGTENTPDATETSEKTTVETTEKQEETVKIAISKDTLADAESFIQSMKEYGAEVTDISDAGGYILIFSKEEHETLLKDKYDETVKKFKEYEDDEKSYVEKVEYDEDFRNLKIFVQKEAWDATSSNMNDIVISSTALSYQLYLEDGQKTDVEIIYSGTDTVVSTFTLPMTIAYEQ